MVNRMTDEPRGYWYFVQLRTTARGLTLVRCRGMVVLGSLSGRLRAAPGARKMKLSNVSIALLALSSVGATHAQDIITTAGTNWAGFYVGGNIGGRSEEHTSELQSLR